MERNHEGAARHVGVEIEFAAVSAEDATGVVKALFGGEIETVDPHQYFVRGTELGDFECKLDFQYAHKTAGPEEKATPILGEFGERLRHIVGDVSSLVAPCEVVCPPLEIAQLPRIDDLREALRRAGAAGTGEGLLYAFGAQLNPEIASRSPEYVLSILQAYMLLSDWLRAEIAIDPARWLLSFADPFPEAYQELVLSEDYRPGMETLIDNHLAYNATRNRELDMLPLFCWLDPQRVRNAMDDPRIKPRPTFHYRLPNAQMQDPGWTIATEWNRWCRVEYLAADRAALAGACRAWLENREEIFPQVWADEVRKWLR